MPCQFTMIFYGPEGTQWALVATEESQGGDNPPGRTMRPRRAQVGCAHLGCPWTDSLLYKYPNIPETLGESVKFSSSRRRVQDHEIQSRHHHGGVHHFHWCLSDDA